MTFEQACEFQREAESLLSGNEYEVDLLDVLTLVRDSECSAYDSEFITLAKRLGVNLITMDKKVLRSFPVIAKSLRPSDH
jgi:predicted nucleic acid-binding protein